MVAGLVQRSLFPRMTEVYRWALTDEKICEWYGVPADMRRSELSRDLEGEFLKAVSTLAADDDVVDALALRLGAFGCRKAIARQRRKHEEK